MSLERTTLLVTALALAAPTGSGCGDEGAPIAGNPYYQGAEGMPREADEEAGGKKDTSEDYRTVRHEDEIHPQYPGRGVMIRYPEANADAGPPDLGIVDSLDAVLPFEVGMASDTGAAESADSGSGDDQSLPDAVIPEDRPESVECGEYVNVPELAQVQDVFKRALTLMLRVLQEDERRRQREANGETEGVEQRQDVRDIFSYRRNQGMIVTRVMFGNLPQLTANGEFVYDENGDRVWGEVRVQCSYDSARDAQNCEIYSDLPLPDGATRVFLSTSGPDGRAETGSVEFDDVPGSRVAERAYYNLRGLVGPDCDLGTGPGPVRHDVLPNECGCDELADRTIGTIGQVIARGSE